MKKIRQILSVLLLLCVTANAQELPVYQWQVRQDRLTDRNWDIKRYETVIIEPTYANASGPVALTNVTEVMLRWKPYGTNATWNYATNGTIHSATGGTVRCIWLPGYAADPAANVYNYEIALKSEAGQNLRAGGLLTMHDSLADAPVTNIPSALIPFDWALYDYINIDSIPIAGVSNIVPLIARLDGHDSDILGLTSNLAASIAAQAIIDNAQDEQIALSAVPPVTTVAGRTGDVIITTSDLSDFQTSVSNNLTPYVATGEVRSVTLDAANLHTNTMGGSRLKLGVRVQGGYFPNTSKGATGANGSAAFGYNTLASGTYGSMASGADSDAIGTRGASAFGDGAHARGDNGAVALGYGTWAMGTNGSIAAGYNCATYGGYGDFAIGDTCRTYGQTDIAMGKYAWPTGNYAYAWSAGIGRNGANPYRGNGSGTFNIDPTNGAYGVFIGETNLPSLFPLLTTLGSAAYADSADYATATGAVLRVQTNAWEIGPHTSFLETNDARNVTLGGALTAEGQAHFGTGSMDQALEVKGDGTRFRIGSADYRLVDIGRDGATGANVDWGKLEMFSNGVAKTVLRTVGTSSFDGGPVTMGGALAVTGAVTAAGSITSSGIANNISVIRTDSGPSTVLYYDDATPSNGQIAEHEFKARDSGANETKYAYLRAYADDVTNGSEDGSLAIGGRVAGTLTDMMVVGRNGGGVTMASTLGVTGAVTAASIKTTGTASFGDDVTTLGDVGVGTASPSRKFDSRGLSIFGPGGGGDTELMLRGQLQTGTNSVGVWNLSVRGDIGGNNDDLKLTRFVDSGSGPAYQDIPLQLQNSTGYIIAPNTYSCALGAPMKALYIDDAGYIGYDSSIRASKMNIVYGIDTSWLYDLQPVSFNYRTKDSDGNYTDIPVADNSIGLIAEDVNEVNPDMVYKDADGNLEGVAYSKMIPALLNEIQELNRRIEALENK